MASPSSAIVGQALSGTAGGEGNIVSQQVADTKSALGEIFESTAQVASFGIDEINQILHALDNPFFTAIIPIKIPHPLFPDESVTITCKFNLSILRIIGIVVVAWWIYKNSPYHPDNDKWGFPATDAFMSAIETLLTLPEAITKGLESVTNQKNPPKDAWDAAAGGPVGVNAINEAGMKIVAKLIKLLGG